MILFAATLLALPQTAAPAQAVADSPAVAETLREMRSALRTDGLARHKAGVLVKGSGTLMSRAAEYELLFTPSGRFREDYRGSLSRTVGFDGETCWEVDWAGNTAALDLEQRETEMAVDWILTGSWLVEGRKAFTVALDESSSSAETVVLDLQLAGARFHGSLSVDRATHLPSSFVYGRGEKRAEIRFLSFAEDLGFRRARRLEYIQAQSVDTLEWNSVEPAPHYFRNPYAPPGRTAASFKPDEPAQLEVKRAPSGHLLVPARIDGGKPRWFIFDTGAGAMTLTSSLAKERGMEDVGEITAHGIGGAVQTRFVRGESVEVGPLTIPEPVWLELDLSFLTGFMGEEIAGVLGYSLFSRSVAEVDMAQAVIRLFDPEKYELRGAEWQRLFLHDRHPCVRAGFEGGREGIFQIDTGAGSSTVVFHAPAVKEFSLLEGRKTSSAGSGGVGGVVKVRSGRIGYFELGGRRFDNPKVEFALEEKGAFDDDYTAGNLGGAFLEPFIMVLDYPHKRIAFVPREERPPAPQD